MSFATTDINARRATVYIGLGSNLEQPLLQIKRALRELDEVPNVELAHVSSFYNTAPVGIINQPQFINAVAEILTTLTPQVLLKNLMAIETAHARERVEKNGPRTLDLDILLFDQLHISEANLFIPHPRMHERAFVLVPLLEIAPDVIIPGMGLAHDFLNQADVSGVRLMGV